MIVTPMVGCELRIRGGCSMSPSMQFGGLFGFGNKDEAGKFDRQGNLNGLGQKPFGPVGVSRPLIQLVFPNLSHSRKSPTSRHTLSQQGQRFSHRIRERQTSSLCH